MTVSGKKRPRRILVALDACSRRLATLEEAADLAVALRAELRGLFVEDDRLLRLARLPFAREIAAGSAAVRELNLVEVERMLRAKADQVRAELVAAAQRVRVRWSFEVARGSMARTSLQAAQEADLLIVGRDQPGLHPLVPRRPPQTDRPVMVVFDGSDAARRGLAIAAEITPAREDRIAILVVAPEDRQPEHLVREVDLWLDAESLPTAGVSTALPEPAALAEICNASHARLLMIASDSLLLDDQGMEQLLELLDCPLALVR